MVLISHATYVRGTIYKIEGLGPTSPEIPQIRYKPFSDYPGKGFAFSEKFTIFALRYIIF